MFSSIWANYSLLPIIFSLFSHESATVLLLKKNDLLTLCSRLYAYLPVLIYLRLTQLTRYCSALLFSSREEFLTFSLFLFFLQRGSVLTESSPPPLVGGRVGGLFEALSSSHCFFFHVASPCVISWHYLREDTHKKKCFFSVRNTKGVGRINPLDH